MDIDSVSDSDSSSRSRSDLGWVLVQSRILILNDRAV